MKKVVLMAILLCTATTLAFAGETAAAVTAAETITLTGTVIDNMCANGSKADLSGFIKTHTKQCAIMPCCAESGYSIYADGKLYAFDKDSSAKVLEFLKKEGSKLEVVVTAKKAGEELSLVAIESQK